MKALSALHSILFATLLTLTLPLQAEQAFQFGDYKLHYSAYRSDTLDASIARTYDIKRSRNYGVLNLALRDNNNRADNKAHEAEFDVKLKNHLGQIRPLDLREIHEGTAIYYLAQFPIVDKEKVIFNIEVSPKNSDRSYTVEFEDKFYTD